MRRLATQVRGDKPLAYLRASKKPLSCNTCSATKLLYDLGLRSPVYKMGPQGLDVPKPLPGLTCSIFQQSHAAPGCHTVAPVGPPQRVARALTCGVDCHGVAPCTGAPHVEGSHIDCVALSGLQLHQGLAGWDAHNRPGQEAELRSPHGGARRSGPSTRPPFKAGN